MSDTAPNPADAPAAVTAPPDDAPPPPPPRDVSQINITDFERRELPDTATGREKRFQVLLRQSVLNQIHRHGQSVQDIEVCGVLVGNVYHDPAGPWLYVQHVIQGNHATQRAAQVTFTADTWTHIQEVMDRDHVGLRILGWYHTHPGFGIFLSDMDVFIQENFFPEAWQTALVYDPKAKEEGVFVWKAGKPDTDKFLVEPDAPVEELTKAVKQARDVSGKGAGMVGDLAQFVDRLDAIEKRQKFILATLALLGLIAIAWPLAVTAFLPDWMQRLKSTPATPPVDLPSDDPTSRPAKL